jgi:hypothetical protein
VSPEYRRLGLAKGMMDGFEQSSDLYSLLKFGALIVDTGLILWICLCGWGIVLRLGCMSGLGIVCIDGSWGITIVVRQEVSRTMRMLMVHRLIWVVTNARYEEAVETGQVKGECTAEWKRFQSFSG